MQNLMLIYHSEAEWSKLSPAEMGAMHKDYFQFMHEIKDSRHYIGGNPLQPTPTATTVRVRDAKRVVTDGPFAETKEQLGGYHLVEAKDLDEALGIAARILGARRGSIEVRPIAAMNQAAQA
jgi:hypothetical protein